MQYISCWKLNFFPFYVFLLFVVLIILSFVFVCMFIVVIGFSSRMASRKCVKMDDDDSRFEYKRNSYLSAI